MLCKCRICKKAFPSLTKVFSCQECRDADEKLFALIEEYLKVYPNSNAIEISNALNIKTELIISYIDEGRLTEAYLFSMKVFMVTRPAEVP